jgi:hypothetical protein
MQKILHQFLFIFSYHVLILSYNVAFIIWMKAPFEIVSSFLICKNL